MPGSTIVVFCLPVLVTSWALVAGAGTRPPLPYSDMSASRTSGCASLQRGSDSETYQDDGICPPTRRALQPDTGVDTDNRFDRRSITAAHLRHCHTGALRFEKHLQTHFSPRHHFQRHRRPPRRSSGSGCGGYLGGVTHVSGTLSHMFSERSVTDHSGQNITWSQCVCHSADRVIGGVRKVMRALAT